MYFTCNIQSVCRSPQLPPECLNQDGYSLKESEQRTWHHWDPVAHMLFKCKPGFLLCWSKERAMFALLHALPVVTANTSHNSQATQ